MLSLFMAIAGGVSWEEVIRPLQEKLGRQQEKLLEGPGGSLKKDDRFPKGGPPTWRITPLSK